MKTRVKWLDHMSFVGEPDSDHSVVVAGPLIMVAETLVPAVEINHEAKITDRY